MILNPHEMSQRDRYKLTTGAIVPRPIAWVSTVDRDGNLNVAPYSFFTCVSTDPLILMFAPQSPAAGQQKDTYYNVLETGEFVINIVNEETAAAMSKTAALLERGVSEFDYAGLTPAPSQAINVPRVAEAPVAFECTLQQVITFNNMQPGGGAAVFGLVQHIYIRDDVYDAEKKYVLLDKLQPIGRLSGNGYAHINDIFELERG
ncbi:MAG: flavin reductase family protein [Anaerolineales bacterium]|nr:flavin reductase family protein [Anaerolineales bacterium]